jgi:hypothetical protein
VQGRNSMDGHHFLRHIEWKRVKIGKRGRQRTG